MALASISLGLAGFLGGIDPRWSSAAALGTVATANAAFASTNESVYQYRRKSHLCSKTGGALRLLKGKFDDVRAAAITGQSEVVHQFVAAVNELLITEHRQWLAAAQDIKPALERLDDTLFEAETEAARRDTGGRRQSLSSKSRTCRTRICSQQKGRSTPERTLVAHFH